MVTHHHNSFPHRMQPGRMHRAQALQRTPCLQACSNLRHRATRMPAPSLSPGPCIKAPMRPSPTANHTRPLAPPIRASSGLASLLPSLLPLPGPWGTWVALLAAGTFGLWSERYKLGKELTGALVATLAGMFIANTGKLRREGRLCACTCPQQRQLVSAQHLERLDCLAWAALANATLGWTQRRGRGLEPHCSASTHRTCNRWV